MIKNTYDTIDYKISELNFMKKYPSEIFYIGNLELLNKPKISIVGSRRPISYTKTLTHKLSSMLSSSGYCIVSGVAMGVDAISHRAAGSSNTIAVVANGLDIKYPAVNKALIEDIQKDGLMLSTYQAGIKATKYTFVHRNEIVVALGEKLIVTQADLNSGSLRSVQYAINMGKEIWVLPHRIGDSQGTNKLIQEGLVKVIYDIDEFIKDLNNQYKPQIIQDDFLQFCSTNPTYDEAVLKYGEKVFEYELLGKISIENGVILV